MGEPLVEVPDSNPPVVAEELPVAPDVLLLPDDQMLGPLPVGAPAPVLPEP